MVRNSMKEQSLDQPGIDRISEQLQEWLTQAKVGRKNALRLRLAMENLLEDLYLHYDRETSVSMEMTKRFGKAKLVIRYPGEAYSPGENGQMGEWEKRLMAQLGLMPVWRYRHGVNELTLKLSGDPIRSEFWLLLAFAAAILLGIARPVLPPLCIDVLTTCFSYLSMIFLNLLGTFAGLLVFLSVVAGICGIGNVSDFSKMGTYLITRNLLLSFLGAGLCAVLMVPGSCMADMN